MKEDQYHLALQKFLDEGNDGNIPLREILSSTSYLLNLSSSEINQDQAALLWKEACKIMRLMLCNGFIAVDIRKDGSVVAWPEQNPEQVFAKIKNIWTDLKGKQPDVGFIVWFHNNNEAR